MAKQNIISDFSALKGKMTFSEKDAISKAEKPKEDTKPPQTRPGRILRAGQKVVLMDSNLRGRIVSVGRTIGIELEDGLTIQAGYGEFAVTEDDEISALKQSKIKNQRTITRTRKCSGSPANGALSVDLHIEAIPEGRNIPKGHQLQFQMETFRKVIRENLPHRGMKICFIHGIGDGILKTAIRKELDEVLALRCSYSIGDPAVTVVTIK